MTARKTRSVRMGSSRLLTFYLIGAGVWLSGGLWLCFHYFLTRQGEFGPQSNPLEPWCLKVHGAFAFAAIWFFGLLWGAHITVAWPFARRRLSGGILTGAILWLVVSGYLLYYVADDAARSILSMSHWGAGLACPVLYWLHRMKKKQKRDPDLAASRRSDIIP